MFMNMLNEILQVYNKLRRQTFYITSTWYIWKLKSQW